MQFHKVPKLGQFAIQILINCIEALLKLLLGQLANGVMCRVVVNVGKQNCLRKGWLDMLSRTAISVATCANLVERLACCIYEKYADTYFIVERTIETVLFSTEDVRL